MKVYVSGTYSAQARLRDEAAKLLHLGHEITNTWLKEEPRADVARYDLLLK